MEPENRARCVSFVLRDAPSISRCALLARYAFADGTIGSRGFIAAVTRIAGPRLFGGTGL
jgi:hypothetical protein